MDLSSSPSVGLPLLGNGEDSVNSPPRHGSRLAYWIFFWLGLGAMLPWNAFITAQSYFSQRFAHTQFASNFENFFSIGYTVTNVAVLAMLIRFAPHLSTHMSITVPLCVSAVAFMVTTALVMYPPEPSTHFGVTMATVLVCGVANGVLGGGLFGLAAKFPPMYTQALCVGQALAGLAVCVVSVSTTAAVAETSHDSPSHTIRGSALTYFITVVVMLVLCVLAFQILSHLPFYHFYSPKQTRRMHPTRTAQPPNTHGGVVAIVAAPAFSVWTVFAVTLSVFPSLTTTIASVSQSSRLTRDLFVPLSMLNFNSGDFLGRTLASYDPLLLRSHPTALVVACCSRLLFLPLFMLCNVSGSDWPTWFDNDWFPVGFMLLFAVSNGYFSTIAMMIAPSKVSNGQQKRAGEIMTFMLQLGLACGSAFSFVLRWLTCACNPFLS